MDAASASTDGVAAAGPAARLRIHGEGGRPESALQRLRRACFGGPSPAAPSSAIDLRIRSLDGRCFFARVGIGRCVDVELPAGTYHVIVDRGPATRSYTMALEAGRASDLHLRLDGAAGRPSAGD